MSEQITVLDEKKLIVFQLENKEYVIPVEEVKSIEKVLPITRVPGTPDYMKGVMNLRGVVIPVIDLKLKFSMTEKSYSDRSRIIIVTVEGHEIGLLVDGANDVIDVPEDSIDLPQNTSSNLDVEFIEGVIQYNKRILIVLNIREVLKEQIAIQ